MPNFATALENNNLKVEDYDSEVFVEYTHPTYANVFLAAIVYCDFNTLKNVVYILEDYLDPPEFIGMLNAIDNQQRDATELAIIYRPLHVLKYIHEELGFHYAEREVICAITHNKFDHLKYLLASEPELFSNYTASLLNTPSKFIAIIKSHHTFAFTLIHRYIQGLVDRRSSFLTNAIDPGTSKNALMLLITEGYAAQIVKQFLSWADNLDYVDNTGKTVLSYLLEYNFPSETIVTALHKMSYISKSDQENLQAYFELVDHSPKDLSKSLTRLAGALQNGRVPKLQREEIVREKQSFFGRRELQLLKHIATQLYFYSVSKHIPLVEVQIMSLRVNGKDLLFIAANRYAHTRAFATLLAKQDIEKLLTERYDDGIDPEGRLRSLKYAEKLKRRVFSDNPYIRPTTSNDENNTRDLIRILRKKDIRHLKIFKATLENNVINALHSAQVDTIFVVEFNGVWNPYRHAEEFLSDIFEIARQLDPRAYAAIGGKKRPCLGCSGRMVSATVNNFGHYPGRFWENSVASQSVGGAKMTTSLLLMKPAFVTKGLSGKKVTDYDTASDSDEEGLTLTKKSI